MTLGEKLRRARVEAGMSQRALCGERITRNMLSQIENGSAKPSMDTLCYLAERLEKPVSYFLEEPTQTIPNWGAIAAARECFQKGQWQGVLDALDGWQTGNTAWEDERWLLTEFALLKKAEATIAENRLPYGAALLEKAAQAEKQGSYGELLRQKRLLLECCLPGGTREIQADALLLPLAQAALASGQPERAVHLLEAAENQDSPTWLYVRGRAAFALEAYEDAARFWKNLPPENFPGLSKLLQQTYEALGDYRSAYALLKRQLTAEKHSE